MQARQVAPSDLAVPGPTTRSDLAFIYETAIGGGRAQPGEFAGRPVRVRREPSLHPPHGTAAKEDVHTHTGGQLAAIRRHALIADATYYRQARTYRSRMRRAASMRR
jgi:hypothetical protein